MKMEQNITIRIIIISFNNNLSMKEEGATFKLLLTSVLMHISSSRYFLNKTKSFLEFTNIMGKVIHQYHVKSNCIY